MFIRCHFHIICYKCSDLCSCCCDDIQVAPFQNVVDVVPEKKSQNIVMSSIHCNTVVDVIILYHHGMFKSNMEGPIE